ncbi:hypothetical protein OEZ86_010637 [Tetradesmus obliquus]|nr:hypothetical protein OEZ86_010637 [Tetradesmus obliquus]
MVGYAAPDTISSATEKVAFDDQHKVVYLASSSQLSALDASAGASPASAAFSRDCQTLLVANGGQADCAAGAAGCSDPEGSVSVVIIRYCPDPAQAAPCGESRLRYKVLTAGFAAWDDKREALLQAGVRLDAASKELIPEHVTFSEDEAVAFVALKGTDYLLIAAGSSFSVLRAAYEPAAAAAAATPEARMPGSPRKGLEQRIAQLTALFDSGTQLSSIANEAGVAEGAAAAAGRAGVAVGDCPGDAAAAAARRWAFVAVRGIAAVFVYDISDPAAPVFQSLVLPPKAKAGAEASAFDAQSGIAYAKYSQGDAGSVPVLLVSYEGQAAGVHGLGMYKLQAQ